MKLGKKGALELSVTIFLWVVFFVLVFIGMKYMLERLIG